VDDPEILVAANMVTMAAAEEIPLVRNCPLNPLIFQPST
jgi:hypothetical protein